MPDEDRPQEAEDPKASPAEERETPPERSAATEAAERKQPAKPRWKPLEPWKVILHNDDKNDMEHVILSIVMLTPIKEQEAVLRMLEAHTQGQALLLTTHKERAELYQQQFASQSLTVTIEPA